MHHYLSARSTADYIPRNIEAYTKQIASLQNRGTAQRLAEGAKDFGMIVRIFRNIGMLFQAFQAGRSTL